MDVVLVLHSHLPWVLHHGRWPHGSDWLAEAAAGSYLPILDTLRRVRAARVTAPVTIGFTPVLANQLADPAFPPLMETWLEERITAAAQSEAALAGSADRALAPVAGFWARRWTRLRELFRSIHGNIPAAFAALEADGLVELMGGAATHGFLPLLTHEQSIDLQLGLGRAEHRRIFGGRAPEGCWLPECAWRPGLDRHLARAGFRWFIADAHAAKAGDRVDVYADSGPARSLDVARPAGHERSPYLPWQVGACTVLLRDPLTSRQVWSRYEGYPGDEHYLEFHKTGWPDGLRLWRVSEPGSDLGDKRPYRPESARSRAAHHARHFVSLLQDMARSTTDPAPGIVAPFDTELFGHWWFEGPEFLGNLLQVLDRQRKLHPATVTERLAQAPPRASIALETGSWGANGDFSMWQNEATAWTWERLADVETRFWRVARGALADSRTHPVLAQAAREMLLAQSSDWQFIISTGNAADYAERRFRGHCDTVEGLLAGLEAPEMLGPALHLAEHARHRNSLFPDPLPAVASVLRVA